MESPIIKSKTPPLKLNSGQQASLLYHHLFDYPLTLSELEHWQAGKAFKNTNSRRRINQSGEYSFLDKKKSLITKRRRREGFSEKKLIIARKAGKRLSFNPLIKMVAVTGALAMKNASYGSDIDLMIITKKGWLWTSRLITLLFLDLFGLPRRSYFEKNQKDKLCLNLWLDESDLVWPRVDRNIYTAHEIAQVIPLVNKDQTYEQFIYQNRWLKAWWPKAVKIKRPKTKKKQDKPPFWLCFIELVAQKAQFYYMRRKITREIVTPTRAVFHPNDWGKIVLEKLKMSIRK